MVDKENWAELCDAYKAADNEARESQSILISKFAAIAAGMSGENPTDEEMRRAENAKAKRDEIDRNMKNFIREKFGIGT